VAKGWSVLFGVVMALSAGLFFVAPFVKGWWLPKCVSTNGAVDGLFYIILFITGFFFILTEALLVIFMWRYTHKPGEVKSQANAHHATVGNGTSFFQRLFHDQHRIELAWTIVPAAILLYIAFAQVNTWADVKYRSRMPGVGPADKTPFQIEVSARQFEWRMRYPNRQRWESWTKNRKKDAKETDDFARNPHPDDVHAVNELHVWTNEGATKDQEYPAFVVQLRTIDVLHSFNIPYMRVKQDSLPGKIIPVWFRPTHWNTKKNPKTNRWEDGYDPVEKKFGDDSQIWEIPCAELCGWGHSRMIGRVYVHQTERDFLDWLDDAEQRQRSHKRETPTPEQKN
jgi:cytochrome c oxidase subunit 2